MDLSKMSVDARSFASCYKHFSIWKATFIYVINSANLFSFKQLKHRNESQALFFLTERDSVATWIHVSSIEKEKRSDIYDVLYCSWESLKEDLLIVQFAAAEIIKQNIKHHDHSFLTTIVIWIKHGATNVTRNQVLVDPCDRHRTTFDRPATDIGCNKAIIHEGSVPSGNTVKAVVYQTIANANSFRPIRS